jgi:hypothetical protein
LQIFVLLQTPQIRAVSSDSAVTAANAAAADVAHTAASL